MPLIIPPSWPGAVLGKLARALVIKEGGHSVLVKILYYQQVHENALRCICS